MPYARKKQPLPRQYKVLDNVVLPSLTGSSGADASPMLAAMPLHAILPRRKPDRSFKHHTTEQGRAYNRTAKKKPKSRWYLADLEQKRQKAAQKQDEIRERRAKGNDWIRQRYSSPKVNMAEEDSSKKGKKRREGTAGRARSAPSALPTAEERQEQRKLERMPWRHQTGRARRRSLLNPHKRIIGLWDPTADAHSQHMEPMRKSTVLRDHKDR